MTKELGFEKFWTEHWPACRRKQKKQAWDQWKKIKPEQYDVIYAAVDRQKKQKSWNTPDCEFIPYPHRWLRDRRWEDEISLPEDADAETLVAAIAAHASMPPEFPKAIAARFRRMCERGRVNWPLLHYRVVKDGGAADQIRKDYLAAE